MNYLAVLGLIAGAAYLVTAAVAFNHTRKRRREDGGDDVAGRMILAMEDYVLVDDEPPYERMYKLGEICASTGRKIFNEKFNFSVESIARLDRAIVKGWGESEEEEVNPQVVLSFGAYLGEVLVRKTKGRWVTSLTENEPAIVLFLAGENETVSVSPFMLIREKFASMYRFDLAIAFTALEQKLKELEAV